MLEAEPNDATPFLPERRSLATLREAAAGCRGCHLWRGATQTVFGEGLKRARVMFVGEQPGDREDRDGAPFVGPAGRLLDKALAEVGIPRHDAYVTNVVKHFKWKPAGKRRIHQKPNAEEIKACRPWLERELEVVQPDVVVCLGATAAQALLGRTFKVTQQHGQWVEWPYEPRATATIHPSAILRAPDDDARQAEREAFTDDLRLVAGALG